MDDLSKLLVSNALSVHNDDNASDAVVEEEWGIFNDPEFWEPKFASGEMHEELREVILERPLWTSPLPGPAKRYQEYNNQQRIDLGQVAMAGPLVLKVQRVTREKWRTVSGQEWEDIDDGRRPNG